MSHIGGPHRRPGETDARSRATTERGTAVTDREGATDLARRFEELRPYLRRLAYSTLGSLADADDVEQEAWLRVQRQQASGDAPTE
ncbi:MAG: hypothetical protein HOQ44_09080, partial [Nocardia sp.]|nr:hypothetical protein [Nocardia sp.]